MCFDIGLCIVYERKRNAVVNLCCFGEMIFGGNVFDCRFVHRFFVFFFFFLFSELPGAVCGVCSRTISCLIGATKSTVETWDFMICPRDDFKWHFHNSWWTPSTPPEHRVPEFLWAARHVWRLTTSLHVPRCHDIAIRRQPHQSDLAWRPIENVYLN